MMVRKILSLLFIVALPVSAAPALDKADRGVPDAPPAIAAEGYKLVKNWDFGVTVKTLAELRNEVHTRFVYEGGQLDRLPANGEGQRCRDNDNHRREGSTLELIAQVRDGFRDGGIESGMLRSKWTGEDGYFEC